MVATLLGGGGVSMPWYRSVEKASKALNASNENLDSKRKNFETIRASVRRFAKKNNKAALKAIAWQKLANSPGTKTTKRYTFLKAKNTQEQLKITKSSLTTKIRMSNIKKSEKDFRKAQMDVKVAEYSLRQERKCARDIKIVKPWVVINKKSIINYIKVIADSGNKTPLVKNPGNTFNIKIGDLYLTGESIQEYIQKYPTDDIGRNLQTMFNQIEILKSTVDETTQHYKEKVERFEEKSERRLEKINNRIDKKYRNFEPPAAEKKQTQKNDATNQGKRKPNRPK